MASAALAPHAPNSSDRGRRAIEDDDDDDDVYGDDDAYEEYEEYEEHDGYWTNRRPKPKGQAVDLTNMRRAPMPVLLRTAGEIIEQQVADSSLLRSHLRKTSPSSAASNSAVETAEEHAGLSRYQQLPRFECNEIVVGKILGRGGFCVVHDIDKLRGVSAASDKAGTVLSGFSVFDKFRQHRERRRQERRSRKTSSVGDPNETRRRPGKKSGRRGKGRSSRHDSFRIESEVEDVFLNGADSAGTQLSGGAVDLSLSKDFIVRNSRSGKKHGSTKGGRGSYSYNNNNNNGDSSGGGGSRPGVTSRAFSPNTASSKYVIKRVAGGAKTDKVAFLKSTVDLAMEAHYLSALHHPNIIALVGMSSAEAHEEEGYFILVEKLDETLLKRFKKWNTLDRTCKGITGVFVGSKRRVQRLYKERIEAAYGIAAGLSYLHQNNVIFRDLKPDNVGFDTDNVVKLFDFGLAREIHQRDHVGDGLYLMTGMTGAIRYMAPEVALGRPYNLAADVYSWSMIMWFILALEPPFGFYTQDMLFDRVHQRGSRPAVFKTWPAHITSAMQRAWDPDISNRPTFGNIKSLLKAELYGLENSTNGVSTVSMSSTASDR